ncbi:hypothetical protein DL766_009876 [Monosporascus sp. MC13-8B]|uniref:Retroviral polymerase SH3-like domain-containing protein n=1 Tax=Monosporascus cannonballus TaxID=155416 RepID=A0ABY0HJT1_9PEZI|nr:hypothetical protein DL762_000290 [Monosporascus cannonballus]RYP13219.1 hypothetical protein DL766_009876 [Monosporascus sp. MC13-8B]
MDSPKPANENRNYTLCVVEKIVAICTHHHFLSDTRRTGIPLIFGCNIPGISHEPSPPYAKGPAGVQERAGGVIITKTRCLIISSNLPSDLWPEAIEAATYIVNRTPIRALGWKTPIQVFNEWLAKGDKTPIPEEGLKASVANIVLFGSEAYALTEAARRSAERLKKMDPRAYIGHLVEYVASNIYRVWIPSQQRVITIRDVTFDEAKVYQGEQKKSLLEVVELNDQIDSILIPPAATTFLGTSRAVFTSDPLDTGITGGGWLEFEELNTYPTAFNAVFSTAIKHDRLYRVNLPAAPKNWQEVMQHKTRDTAHAEEFLEKLMQRFHINDLGELQWFLGMRILRDRAARKLWLSQDTYWEKLYTRFELSKLGKRHFKVPRWRDLKDPTHLGAVDEAILHAHSTRTLALEFGGDEDPNLRSFLCASDASFADNPDRKSSQGFVLSLFGGPIVWRANKQDTVTTSSTEAELLALSQTVKEAFFMLRLFKAIGLELGEDLVIQVDNKQTIRLVTEETIRLITKLKHVDVHNHWLREIHAAGRMKIEWTPTNAMVADGLTKPLKLQQHQKSARLLNLHDVASRLQEA